MRALTVGSQTLVMALNWIALGLLLRSQLEPSFLCVHASRILAASCDSKPRRSDAPVCGSWKEPISAFPGTGHGPSGNGHRAARRAVGALVGLGPCIKLDLCSAFWCHLPPQRAESGPRDAQMTCESFQFSTFDKNDPMFYGVRIFSKHAAHEGPLCCASLTRSLSTGTHDPAPSLIRRRAGSSTSIRRASMRSR